MKIYLVLWDRYEVWSIVIRHIVILLPLLQFINSRYKVFYLSMNSYQLSSLLLAILPFLLRGLRLVTISTRVPIKFVCLEDTHKPFLWASPTILALSDLFLTFRLLYTLEDPVNSHFYEYSISYFIKSHNTTQQNSHPVILNCLTVIHFKSIHT